MKVYIDLATLITEEFINKDFSGTLYVSTETFNWVKQQVKVIDQNIETLRINNVGRFDHVLITSYEEVTPKQMVDTLQGWLNKDHIVSDGFKGNCKNKF